MSRLLGGLFTIATFPGVLVSTAAQNACDARYLPTIDELDLEEIGLDGDDDWSEEAPPLTPGDVWGSVPYGGLVASTVVPFVLSTALALVIFLVSEGVLGEGTLGTVALWLGVSVAVHAFPNRAAASALWSGSLNSDSPLRFVGLPLAGLSRLANLLRVVWLDLLYGVGLLLLVRGLLGVA